MASEQLSFEEASVLSGPPLPPPAVLQYPPVSRSILTDAATPVLVDPHPSVCFRPVARMASSTNPKSRTQRRRLDISPHHDVHVRRFLSSTAYPWQDTSKGCLKSS